MAIDLEVIQARLNEALPGAVVDRDGDWLVVDAGQLVAVATHLRDEMGFDYLTNLSASDYADRIEVVYNVFSTRLDLQGPGLPFKVRVGRSDPQVPSLTPVWKAANFHEREVWDMFGVRFAGHPNLKRILLWEGFEGHPLRKDWHEPYFEQEQKPYGSRWPAAANVRARSAEERVRWRANVQYPPGFDPHDWEPLPEVDVDSLGDRIDVNGLETDRILLNIGPQHPSTHGVFRMVIGLQGETVTTVYPVVGHLHRNHEKIGERNLWTGNIPYTDRLDYISPMYNEFGYVVAVEKMMGQEVPERAEYIRVIVGELQRIVNHLLAIGFFWNELGAMMTPMLYAFTEREHVLDLYEAVGGSRMMVNYFRIGGVARDLPEGWLEQCRRVADRLDRKIDEFDFLLTDNEIFVSRTRGVSAMGWQEMASYGVGGPMLRSAGLKYDIRRVEPYSIYDSFDFDVPTFETGDLYDRYRQRIAEARESVKIIRQALNRIPSNGSIQAGKKPWNPKVPAGEAYSRVEHPKGELGFYLVSDGGTNAYRYHVRSPCFAHLGALEAMSAGYLLADLIVILGTVDITMGEVDR